MTTSASAARLAGSHIFQRLARAMKRERSLGQHFPRVSIMLDDLLAEVKALPEGDYAECGVWRGEIAQYISERMPPDATLWLFDSFQGHPEPGPFDDAAAHPKGRYTDTSMEMVHAKVPQARLVPGWLPGTLEVVSERKFRFVRVDTDHYASTKSITEFFLSRMVAGGIIQFDDYNHYECPGATKAINEVIGQANVRMPAHYKCPAT
jgi:O-methyltransferase